MIESVLHRRMTFTLATVALAISVLVGLPPSAAHAAATWKPQKSGTELWLSSVAFTDATHGWAVGLSHTMLATIDGGATWAPQTSGTAHVLHLTPVAFTDADHGWAVSADGIVATTDGGATWVAQEPGTDLRLNSITFIDASHGCAVGAHFNAGSGVVAFTCTHGDPPERGLGAFVTPIIPARGIFSSPIGAAARVLVKNPG